jgi:hypothetical protein
MDTSLSAAIFKNIQANAAFENIQAMQRNIHSNITLREAPFGQRQTHSG